ncbi:6185_t:CDS:2 [Rhizophagus irregularis]|nr:6185_t:CDS:2 [Rhizophagus irregularis]
MYVNKCLIKPIRNTKKSEIPSISVPFPPELTVEEILRRRPDAKLGSRAPNRFFIYRLAYIKELRKRVDDTVSMTKISPHIGLSWAKESTSVKEAYKKLSDKVEERLKEIRQNETLDMVNYEHHHWPYYYESNAPCFWLVEDNSILVDFNNTIESILNQQFDY